MRWLRAARSLGPPVVSQTRAPLIRSGTPLEVAEISWFSEGVSREGALAIPSVRACRNLIVGATVQMSWYRYRGEERLDPGWLLTKPDPSTTLPMTLGGTVDDLLFHGRAYWRVLERDAEGYPRRARWTPVIDVTPLTESTGGTYAILTGYRVAGVPDDVPPGDVIRFDCPLPGILDTSTQVLAGSLDLEQAARRLANVQLPAGTITNEGEPVSPEEAAEYVEDFQNARATKGVAFLQNMSYSRESIGADDIALVDGRSHWATEIARLFNVPVAMIGASPSGGSSALLYGNLTQQEALFVSTAVAPYLRTVEATMSDALPYGQSVAFDTGTFLRSDPDAATDHVLKLLGAGLITPVEGRAMLGIPPSTAIDLTPGRI